jgi:hypothetical protein
LTEVKETIVDLNFNDTEFKDESEIDLKHKEKEVLLFPEIKPFYISWFWPTYR